MSTEDRAAAMSAESVIEGLLRRLYEFDGDDHPAEEAARAWLAEHATPAAAPVPEWTMVFYVTVAADNEQDARAAFNRVGDRIEDHPMVVGCEDSPLRKVGA